MVEQTGCDAVMIGRAAPANPWIFRQIAQYTALGRYDEPSEQDRYRLIRTYFGMLLGESDLLPSEPGNEQPCIGHSDPAKAHKEAQGKMKQFASWFTHGVPGGSALRKAIYEAKTGPAILDAVERFFEPRLTGSADTADLPRSQSPAPPEAATVSLSR